MSVNASTLWKSQNVCKCIHTLEESRKMYRNQPVKVSAYFIVSLSRKQYSTETCEEFIVLMECRGLAVECTGLKFWCCQKTRMWVRFPVAALVSLSKTLNHNCFVLRMGRKTVGPVCCVMHVKEPRTLIVKEKGACPGASGLVGCRLRCVTL